MNSVEGSSHESASNHMVSFKISAKIDKTDKKSLSDTTPKGFYERNANETIDEEKDGILVSKKDDKSKLVIPMIKQNRWNCDGSDEHDEVSRLAAKEILKDLDLDDQKDKNEDLLPILMRNRIPPPKDGADMDEKYDISLRPEGSTMEDYENIPISSFGSAMLRGMGWEKGKALGLTNKGLCDPVEFIPRYKGLGLGAQKKLDEKLQSKKRKLGESPDDGKKYNPIVEKDGRVRHIKRLGEVVPEQQPEGFHPGSSVIILKESHKDLYGKIISVDEDTARISVKLLLSGEMLHLSQHNVRLVDKIPSSNQEVVHSVKVNQTNDEKYIENKLKKRNIPNGVEQPVNWVAPNIRVRIISRLFENGRYYNKKVTILDVTDLSLCTCKTDENKLLEDVHEKYLETVIPKTKGSYVYIVLGKYKGRFAKLLERNKDKNKATVQLTSNMHVTNVNYDCLSEFTGEIPDDDFL